MKQFLNCGLRTGTRKMIGDFFETVRFGVVKSTRLVNRRFHAIGGTLAVLWTICSVAGSARGETIVVPNELARLPGAAATEGIWFGSSYWLQLYNVSQFSLLPPEGAFLTSVSFRSEEGQLNGFDMTYEHLRVTLATFGSDPDTLPLRFREAEFPDSVAVFSQSAVRLSGRPSTEPTVPAPFDLTIEFVRPFLYKTSLGHLIMNLETGTALAGTSALVDADGFTALPYPARASYPGFAGENRAVHAALVAEFSFTAVPEPRSIAVAVAGIVLITLYGFIKRSS